MSDVDMEMSPRSDLEASDHSDVEKPPTPGSNQDETESEVVKSVKVTDSNQENDSDEGNEEKHSVVSPISPISPNNEASPISLNNEDEEKEDDMEIEEENIEQEDDNEQKDEKEISEEKDSSQVRSSDGENKANVESLEKLETNDVEDEENKTSFSEINEDTQEKTNENDNNGKGENGKNESKGDDEASSKKDNLEDGDLLNITEISDLSVDLTGDEAAIVEDILQNASGDELLADGEEKPADSQEQTSEEKSQKPNDDENEEQPGGTGELLNDIFGSSDEDDEEFQGFEEDELHGKTKIKKKPKPKPEKKGAIVSDDEEEEASKTESQPETKPPEEETLTVPPPEDSDSDDEEPKSQVFVSDFDRMMEQKKEERGKIHRRRKNVDIINDNDDLVAGIIKKMQEAAEEDKLANEARQAATKKLQLLPSVLRHMLKVDLMLTFVDSHVLPVLKEWISPLPDGSLPHIQIREGILKILEQLPPVDSGSLKVSGIGKAVMYLFRHPKESRKNKERAGKIISEWSRPIFGVTANFKSMSREEREERDYANMSKRRRLSSDGVDGGKTPKRIENAIKSDSKKLRPGDKGWCMRARVPAPSNKDYVVRPKSNVEFTDFSKASKKTLNRFEKQKRKMAEKKTGSKQRAVEISLEGRNMAL